MLAALGQQGVGPEGLEAKIFGGAAMFTTVAGSERQSVGEQNILRAEEELRRQRIRVTARDVGGTLGRKLYFVTSTGDVYLKRLMGGMERVALPLTGGRP
jgi:chemotaxis protein CheD